MSVLGSFHGEPSRFRSVPSIEPSRLFSVRFRFGSGSSVLMRIPSNIDGKQLIQKNTTSAETSMRILSSIGLNATGLSRLLSTQLYAQFIRPKLEYGVAITSFTKTALKQIEQAQNKCIRMIYGAHKNSETKVMRHITNLPSMNERVNILQAKYIYRAQFLPEDTLFIQLLPNFNQQPSNSQWIALCKSTIWQLIEDQNRTPTTQELKLSICQHRVENHVSKITAATGSKTLAACRPKLGIDPIMWIPMSNKECSRCIRW